MCVRGETRCQQSNGVCVCGNMMSREQWCGGGGGGYDVNGAMVCVWEHAVKGAMVCVCGNMMSMEQWCVCVWEHDVNGAMVCVQTFLTLAHGT